MTTQELSSIVAGIGLPYAYYQFPPDDPNNPPPDPPFICYFFARSNDLYADDSNYATINHLVIELYSDDKDFEHEAAVESALRGAELPWSKSETYLDDERMYMTTYDTEVLIHVQQQ